MPITPIRFAGHFSLYGSPAEVSRAKQRIADSAAQSPDTYGTFFDEKEFAEGQSLVPNAEPVEIRRFTTGTDALRQLFKDSLVKLRELYEQHQAGKISDQEWLEASKPLRQDLPPAIQKTALFEKSPHPWRLYAASDFLNRFERFDLETGEFKANA